VVTRGLSVNTSTILPSISAIAPRVAPQVGHGTPIAVRRRHGRRSCAITRYRGAIATTTITNPPHMKAG
jgi:hypothetical protein